MTPKEQAAMQQALEALEACVEKFYAMKSTGVIGAVPMQAVKAAQVITALREALAESNMNLNCKSVQARLATSRWYVRAEQAEQIPQKERKDFIDGYDAGMADAKRMQQAEQSQLADATLEPVAYRVWDRMGGISYRRTKPIESEYVEWDALYAAPVSIEAAVLAEREECAKVCDELKATYELDGLNGTKSYHEAAAAIRNRSNK